MHNIQINAIDLQQSFKEFKYYCWLMFLSLGL